MKFQHPYPTEDEKRTLASQTSLTLLQVNNWLVSSLPCACEIFAEVVDISQLFVRYIMLLQTSFFSNITGSS